MSFDFFKKLFFNMSINSVVSIGLVGIIFFSIIGSNYVIFIKKQNAFEENLLQEQVLHLSIIANIVEKPLQTKDFLRLEKILNEFFHYKNIIEITLKDEKDEIRYHKHLPQRALGKIYKKTYTLLEGETKLGSIYIKVSNNEQYKKLSSYIKESLMIFLVQFFVVFIFIYIFIRFKISLPIKKLATSIKDIKDKNFITTFSWDYQDEFNTLGKELDAIKKDFNNLILKDPLTDIYNRRFLENKITQLIESKKEFCVICFDIDGFKEINDSYGYKKGDEVLKALVIFVQKYIKKEIFGRWNSQEFMIILENTKLEEGYAIAKNLQEGIYAKAILPTLFITCSFGVSIHKENEELLELLKRVDKALFMAKVEGKNRVITL
jgi:diguanylate cyclase (GGDEF)-like protein